MTALCTARGCPHRTQTMLCAGCLAALVDALRALAHGAVIRRDKQDRPSDSTPRQGLLDDLQDTVTRTDNISPSGVGRVRGSDVASVEFHVAASHLADRVRNTVSTWARDVHESNPHLHLPSTHAAACAWLAGLPGILAMHPAAGDMYGDIVPLVDRVERMVDLRPDLTYLGICSARVGDAECDWDVFAERDDTVVQCRSKACGATHEVEYRKGVMLNAMQDQLLTAVDMRTALTRYMPQGVPSVNTIRSWANRKRLIQRSPLPGSDQPRYRVGDVLDLIARQDEDEGKRRKGTA